MKKLLLASAILAFGATAFGQEDHVYFKVGGDLNSEYSDIKIKDEKKKQESFNLTKGKTRGLGYEIAVEATRNITNNFELGIGISYQNHKKLKVYNNHNYKITMGKYDSVPLYLTGKYNFNSVNDWIPYFKVNLGYSFNVNEKKLDVKKLNENKLNIEKLNLNVKNGLYAGVGIGAEYNNFLIDLTYSINKAKATLKTKDGEKSSKFSFDQGKLTLSIGYKFDF